MFEQLIEHANDLIYALSPEGRLIWFNEQLINLSGYTREELIGRSHLDLATPSQKALAAERFTRPDLGLGLLDDVRRYRCGERE